MAERLANDIRCLGTIVVWRPYCVQRRRAGSRHPMRTRTNVMELIGDGARVVQCAHGEGRQGLLCQGCRGVVLRSAEHNQDYNKTNEPAVDLGNMILLDHRQG